MTALLLPLLVLLGTVVVVNSEIHSLTYIYTAISKPSGVPGVHEFTAMGLLDGRMIDYYDSETQKKVPRQPWIKRLKPEDYWSQGSESRKREHESLKNNMDLLLNGMRENKADSHTLQWLHGCEGKFHPGRNMTLGQMMAKYGWDGEDFLSFDNAKHVWKVHSPVASDSIVEKFTKGSPDKECLGFLEEFVDSEKEVLKNASPPEVFTLKKKARVESNTILVCMATGFISEDTDVMIKQDGRSLTRQDGLTSGEVLPNGDQTFQRTVHVEIVKSDKSIFTCEVFDVATKRSLKIAWEDEPAETSMAWIGGVVGGPVLVLGLVVGAVVGFLMWKRRQNSVHCHCCIGGHRSPVPKDDPQSSQVRNGTPTEGLELSQCRRRSQDPSNGPEAHQVDQQSHSTLENHKDLRLDQALPNTQ